MVAGAADMIRRRGLRGTSVRELAEHSGAPLGSTYHYFPGGKEQLATEAVQFAGDAVSQLLREQLEAGPVAGMKAFLALWRRAITSSEFRAGCPVLAVTIEEPDDEAGAPLEAAARAFATWETLLADAMRQHGAAREDASRLATLMVASVEGAVAMCRARRSTQPLDQIAPQLETLVAAAIAPSLRATLRPGGAQSERPRAAP
jgi:AcrR family transcriptional regulator